MTLRVELRRAGRADDYFHVYDAAGARVGHVWRADRDDPAQQGHSARARWAATPTRAAAWRDTRRGYADKRAAAASLSGAGSAGSGGGCERPTPGGEE